MRKKKKFGLVIFIIVIVILIAVLGYLLYKQFSSNGEQNNTATNNSIMGDNPLNNNEGNNNPLNNVVGDNEITSNTTTNDLSNTANQQPNISLLEGYKWYNSAYYSVQYKSDWTQQMGDSTNVNLETDIFYAPDNSTCVSVVTEQLAMAYTLDQYVNTSLDEIKTAYGLSDSDISKENVTVNGVNGYRISYLVSGTVETIQIILVKDKIGYVITYNNVGDYTDVYSNMENTFVIK
ncbi:MAG: hypothetical protein FWF46_07620 [Oscillospiraceae bacterium]|nr:hypothetical protein [Oscillospiraceae bacterium]